MRALTSLAGASSRPRFHERLSEMTRRLRHPGHWRGGACRHGASAAPPSAAGPAVAGRPTTGDQTQSFKPVKSSKRAVVFRPRRVDVSTVVDASVRFKLHRASKVVERTARGLRSDA